MGRKVTIIGSGNWGATIAKIVGFNAMRYPELENIVTMWVFEEMVNGEKLTEIINKTHENVKYLPGIALPHNVIAEPDLQKASADADILVFVVPHQFLPNVCKQMSGHLKKGAYAVSLIKGLSEKEDGTIELISDMIRTKLEIPTAVLMGANLAHEVSKEYYCEATVGCSDHEKGQELKKIMQTDYFRIVVVKDEVGVELCGALKNVVAVGAGFADGLGYGDNTKAAVIRLGLMEMMKLMQEIYKERNIVQGTFLESCGIADLVTTCYGGRNRRIAEAFVKTRKTIAQLEKEMLNGQSAQGPLTARELYLLMKQLNITARYPIFACIHEICSGQKSPDEFIHCLRDHPEHM